MDNLPEVTDLETARLALRGAVDSLRSLQDVNMRLKGEMQEYASRNKALEQRLITLQTEVSAASQRLEQQDQIFAQKEQALRRSVRQEVSAEENERWQVEFNTLKQSLDAWKLAEEQKDAQTAQLKTRLAEKEQDVISLQNEKIALQSKATHDLVQALGKTRSDLRQAVEAIVQEKDVQLAKAQAQWTQEREAMEKRLQEKELDIQEQNENIAARFHERQKELSEFWSQREQEMWDRTHESKVRLEAELKERWESRREELSREFEKKAAQMKQELAQQRAELQQRDQDLHAEIEKLKQDFQKRR